MRKYITPVSDLMMFERDPGFIRPEPIEVEKLLALERRGRNELLQRRSGEGLKRFYGVHWQQECSPSA